MLKNVFSLLFFICTLGTLVAQTDRTFYDTRIWLSGGVEKKITRSWYADAKVAIRFNENISEVGSYLADAGIGKKILNGKFRIEVHYRYSGKSRDDGTFRQRHRYYVDLIYKLKTGTPLHFTARGRYQVQYTDVFTSEAGFNNAKNIRGALTAAYKIKRYDPYISAELFYLFDNSEREFSRVRYTIGLDFELNKRNKFDFSFMHQRELNAENPTRAFIIGVSYRYIL